MSPKESSGGGPIVRGNRVACVGKYVGKIPEGVQIRPLLNVTLYSFESRPLRQLTLSTVSQ